MAKQKEDLTLQEKLDKALVADWEQPYKVPDNWVWTRLGNICIFENGYAFKSTAYGKTGIPLIRISNICNGEVDISDCVYIDDKNIDNRFIINNGDLLIAMSGATTGKNGIYKLDEPAYLNQRVGNIKILHSNLLSQLFRNYYVESKTDELLKSAYGGAQPNISPTVMGNFAFPLPPLAEQQRIVNRIESLFAKLDSAKELAQTALDTFGNRKAAILHKAFTGELTKKIIGGDVNDLIDSIQNVKYDLINQKKIKKQKVTPINEGDIKYTLPKHWKFIKLGDIAFVTKLAGFEYTKHIHLTPKGDIPAIRAQNVRKGFLDKKNLLYIDKETSNILQRSALTKKSILVTFIGAGIGDVCLFNEKTRFHLAPNVAKCEIYNGENELLLPEYVLYYLLSEYGQSEIFKHMKATAQPSLSMETIRDIVIPITSFKEQTEIVRILDSIFEKEAQAKERANVIEKITLMKKAILARAFRGKLGTNNAEEESAKELLMSILEED